jgi:hypothetical protein
VVNVTQNSVSVDILFFDFFDVFSKRFHKITPRVSSILHISCFSE